MTFVIGVETYMMATRTFVWLFPGVMVSVVDPDGLLYISSRFGRCICTTHKRRGYLRHIAVHAARMVAER